MRRETEIKTKRVKFSLLQITYWISFAAFTSFAMAYARSKGMSAVSIGIMGAVYKLGAVVGQFFWGGICDRRGANRAVFILTNLLTSFTALLFFYDARPGSMIAAYAMLGFFQLPTASNLDTWIIKSFSGSQAAYGPIRSMGSLGYAVFILFYGMLVANTNYAVMPYYHMGFIAISVLLALLTPNASSKGEGIHMPKITKADVVKLFSDKTYLLLLLTLFFMGLTTQSVAQMKILIWESMGASIAYQGYDGFVAALFQFPMLLLASKIIRFSPHSRFTAGVLLDFSMIVIIYFAQVPQLVVMCSVLSGFSYGLLLPAMRQLVSENTPDTLQTTAQGIADATYMSLSGMIGGLLAGSLTQAFGIKQLILICAFVEIIPIMLVLLTGIRQWKQRLAAGAAKAQPMCRGK